MTTLRLLLLNYEFPPLGGGAGNATYYLVKEFAKRDDIKIDLVTSSTDGFRQEDFAPNIRIFFLDIGKRGNLHYQSQKELLTYSLKALRVGKRLKAEAGYDVVHAFFGIPCGVIAMKLGIPYIVSLRGSDVPFFSDRLYWHDKLVFKNLSRRVWKKAREVVAISYGLKALAQKSAPDQPIAVIPNGVDTDAFRPIDRADSPFTIISTSRLIPRKKIDYVIRAFIPFAKRHSEAKLILVGGGVQEEELKTRVRTGGVDEQVSFVGAVGHDKMPQLYPQADVYVSASMNEGMSNSMFEAMACGLAIVTTETGGTHELVDESNGITIQKENAEDIEEAFERLYQDRAVLRRMQRKSRQKAEKWSWKKKADLYSDLYRRIV